MTSCLLNYKNSNIVIIHRYLYAPFVEKTDKYLTLDDVDGVNIIRAYFQNLQENFKRKTRKFRCIGARKKVDLFFFNLSVA